ncbi:alpha beta hydrolase domain-containing protein [Boletus reticuloceps]|uniref:Alpha beta hydrolase domain-containing protein n=1 Tax=Boletus reticuloceps TaxID=495285 RepID=A0A8I2YHD1_9AGAM|nr:alpha beta hydrolase domain-containing protein [Boletus reticuloceps]
MDVIKEFQDTTIEKINMPTLAAFIPVLNEKKAEIDKIERKEFQYGQKNRHYLDVYYPPTTCALSTSNGKLPVLFFIYGGGYNTGSRRLPEPYEMGYRALGSSFAARGFLTVIPDYRLVPEVRFPSASEDLRDALLWVAGHAAEVAGEAKEPESARTELDPGCVFMLAHSAGAAHTLVLHLYPPLRASLAEKAAEVGLRVRGLVLNGSPWYFGVRGEKFTTTGPVKFYFGGEAQQKEREPGALWAALGEEDVRGLPEVLLLQAEREPDWLKVETKEIMNKEIREKLGVVGRELEETYIAAGHNHVSMNWVLGTGDAEGEKWGDDVVEWIKARLV